MFDFLILNIISTNNGVRFLPDVIAVSHETALYFNNKTKGSLDKIFERTFIIVILNIPGGNNPSAIVYKSLVSLQPNGWSGHCCLYDLLLNHNREKPTNLHRERSRCFPAFIFTALSFRNQLCGAAHIWLQSCRDIDRSVRIQVVFQECDQHAGRRDHGIVQRMHQIISGLTGGSDL